MTRSKFSTKVLLLATGIGLSVAAFAGWQPAAAQADTNEYCPAGTVYDPIDGCTVAGLDDDYGYAYGPYYRYHNGFNHGLGHGFAHGMGSEGHDLGLGRGMDFAHFGGGGFGHGGMGGGFGHGGGGGHR